MKKRTRRKKTQAQKDAAFNKRASSGKYKKYKVTRRKGHTGDYGPSLPPALTSLLKATGLSRAGAPRYYGRS
jgi:hypothetical protein